MMFRFSYIDLPVGIAVVSLVAVLAFDFVDFLGLMFIFYFALDKILLIFLYEQ